MKSRLLILLALVLALALPAALAEEEVVSAPVELEVGEADEAELWTGTAEGAAEAPAEQAVSAVELKDSWTKEQFEGWYEGAKLAAQSADHILGEGGDILTNFQTLILPGETIAVVPANAGISDSGWVKYGKLDFAFNIYQLNGAVVNTAHNEINLLPRTGAPAKATLTEVQTSTFKVPYLALGNISDLEAGSIPEITYVSLYRNDTGLPLFIGREFAENESAGIMLGHGDRTTFQGMGTFFSKPTFWFLEPYYIMDFNDAPFKQRFEKDTSALVCDDGKTSWLKAKSPFPIKLYIDGETHTYEIPNPLMKGGSFWKWGEGEPWETGWRWGELPSRSHTVIEDAAKTYRYEFTNEKTVLRINMRDVIRETVEKGNGQIGYLHDVLFFPNFDLPRPYVSQDTLSIGFNPQGGKVNGQDYYLCNAPGFDDNERKLGVDIGKIVPVREGYKFLGWCTDPKDEKGTLIKDTSIEASSSWRENGHVELYAAWSGGAEAAKSIKGAKVTVKNATWTGKATKPTVTVKLGTKTLKAGTDYTVSCTDKKIGPATATIKGKGNYKGTLTKAFKIIPKKVSGLKLSAGTKKLTVKWTKGKGGMGYQIQYGLKKNFNKAKTVTITQNATVKKVLKSLKSKKTYYVRMRGYKKVGSVTYTSAWSKTLSAKVK